MGRKEKLSLRKINPGEQVCFKSRICGRSGLCSTNEISSCFGLCAPMWDPGPGSGPLRSWQQSGVNGQLTQDSVWLSNASYSGQCDKTMEQATWVLQSSKIAYFVVLESTFGLLFLIMK